MKKNIWKKEGKFLKVLAPMAGYTDSAFRLLCREMGADLVVTELISADAIAYNKYKVKSTKLKVIVESNTKNNSAELLSYYKAERPLVVQLFGKYPEKFGKAAKWVTENLHPDGIDINMGCPARKVVGSDHGAALLKNPTLAVEIVKAVKANTDLPVSVKTRLGWENDDEILEFAPLLIEAGIDAITIHGRTYKDGFKGLSRWENIYKVKKEFGQNISVIGNGDVGEVESRKYQVSRGDKRIALDGIAIGRAAFGNPWIFRETVKSRKYKVERGTKEDLPEFKRVIMRHAELAFETKGEHGMVEFRKHLLAYLKGFPEAKKYRLMAVEIKSVDDVKAILHII